MKSRSLVFPSGSLALEGELILPDEDPALLVILCHGLPSGRSRDDTDTGYAGFARTIAEQGFASFWFDFRGARQSPGDFSIRGWVDDLHAALNALNNGTLPAIPTVLVGSSAGGVVCAVTAAERDDIFGLAVLAAPASWGFTHETRDRLIAEFKNAGMIREPSFPADPQAWWEEWETYSAERFIGRVSPRPVLIIHGEADDVVPYLHAERLYSAAGAPKELARIPQGGHQLRKDSRALDCLTDWLERITP